MRKKNIPKWLRTEKLHTSHAQLHNQSTSMTGFAVEDGDEDFPPVDNG